MSTEVALASESPTYEKHLASLQQHVEQGRKAAAQMLLLAARLLPSEIVKIAKAYEKLESLHKLVTEDIAQLPLQE